MKLDSLAFRLFATAALWTLLALPLAGWVILSLYRQEVETSFDDRIKTLLLVVFTDSTERATGEPGAPRDVGEPLFEITHSGWYWQIKPTGNQTGRRTLVSKSLASETLPSPHEQSVAPDSFGVHWSTVTGPKGEPLRVAEMIQALGGDEGGPRYSYLVAGPLEWPEARVSAFETRLFSALFLVGFGLLALTLFQIRFGLLPLRRIERGLLAIRTGSATKLEGKLPQEIEPLQVEINALMQSNQDIIDRARTQVGNLAHALKTPLAVITNEAGDDRSPFARKVAEQAKLMRDQINYYLDRAQMAARASTIGRVTPVEPVMRSLQRTLERIYEDKGVSIRLACDANARFQGEKQDFEEMLGNLVDNACKWARTTVYVTAEIRPRGSRTGRKRLTVFVEDDGPGLSAEQLQRIGKRGIRLDETKPGSGLGLSIVNDLAVSYSGQLQLGTSPHGGLKATLELPAV
ncbi:MAG: ATP-binding protein [Hyphomicrobiaceae bacterium]